MRRRLVWRLAAGQSTGEAAAREGCAAELVETLLADPETQLLIEDWAALDALDEEARRAELIDIAWIIMRRALLRGDLRVALFVAKEEAQGRDPCRTLARSLEAQRSRANAATPPRPRASASAPAHQIGSDAMPDPVRAATSTAARHLRHELAAEVEAQAAINADTVAMLDEAPTPDTADAGATPPKVGPAAPAPPRPTSVTIPAFPDATRHHAFRQHLLAGIAIVGMAATAGQAALTSSLSNPSPSPAIRAGPRT